MTQISHDMDTRAHKFLKKGDTRTRCHDTSLFFNLYTHVHILHPNSAILNPKPGKKEEGWC